MIVGIAAGCSGDEGTEADRIGVGAECTADPGADPPSTCPVVEMDIQLDCLTQFTGGYCGLEGCEGDVGCPEGSRCCPEGSRCVANTDGKNYCFRVCQDKPECNRNRSVENERSEER
ncbi:MAG: hypothetical protein JRJ80_12400, partial [Deltaproteobacteria bacterium]|nr:hypothetical protein [Deltaproteobacteria bacterium]